MKQKTMCAVAALFAVAALCVESAAADRAVVSVMNYRNLGADEHSYAGAGIAGALAADLASSPKITVVTPEARDRALGEIMLSQLGVYEDQIKIGRLLAASYIATGSYRIDRDELTITTDFIDVKRQKILESFRITGSAGQLREKQEQIAFTLLQLLREKGVDLGGAAFQDRARRKAGQAAYRYYCMGLEKRHADPRLALTYFQKAVNADGEFIDAIGALAELHSDVFSRHETAVRYLDAAGKVLRARNETATTQYAAVMGLKGRAYLGMAGSDASPIGNAIECFHASLNVLKVLKRADGFEYSELMNDYGVALGRAGKRDEGVDCLRAALDLKEKLGMEEGLSYAVTCGNLAGAYAARNELREAKRWAVRALEIKKGLSLEKTKTYAVSLSDMGCLLCREGRSDDALERFQSALAVMDSLGLVKTAEAASLRANMGYAHARLGSHERALARYREAQEIREGIGAGAGLEYASTATDIARLYHGRLGDHCAALPWARKAASIKKRFGVFGDADAVFLNEIVAKCGR